MKSELESTYDAGGATDVPLAEYLARPVLLRTYSVDVGSRLNQFVSPWAAWHVDSQVRNRLEGFRHVRGTLCVRVTVNGNPMLFGDVIMSYEPRDNRSMHVLAPITSRAHLVQITQRPYVYLNPTTSEGGEMRLPFFCPENWLDTVNTTSFISMGTLRFSSVAPLRHANSAGGKFTVNVFAWLEDAEVCTPTASLYGEYTYQNGMGSEYASAPISKTASAIAKGAGMLSEIPILAPYALATEMAASAVARVAHIFGFSRPQVMTNPARYREHHAGQLANVDTHELVNRLAYESKGQLTVDPRTVGLAPVDEMSLKYLCTRESIVDTFTWNETQLAGTVLRRINVSPVMFNRDSTVTPNRGAFCPMMFASLPFRYWRGKVILRLKIVASALHRGRIRVSYDPAGSSAVGGYNQVYSRIVDLETNRDVEIPIEWHAPQPWLNLHKPDISDTTDTPFATTLACDTTESNGQITISVLNDLTSPDDSLGNDVTVLVHAKGGDDMEFCAPADFNTLYTFRAPGGTIEPQNALGEQDNQADEPEMAKSLDAIGNFSLSYDSHLNKVFFGEAMTSLRTLARRYTVLTSGPNDGTTALNRQDVTTTYMPVLEYIMSGYTGWRGSIRYKFIQIDPDARMSGAAAVGNIGTAGLNDAISGIFTNRGAIEIEVPFYSIKRFEHTRTHPQFAANTDTRLTTDNPNLAGVYYRGQNNPQSYYAGGEDFSCFFFVGAPLIYSV